jgi:hypothetical protein
MAASRYARTPILDFGRQYGTTESINNLRAAIKAGTVPTKTLLLRGVERLDTLAGTIYGDSRYWWVLAAASDIGWGMQVPAGTVIRIPDLGAVVGITG